VAHPNGAPFATFGNLISAQPCQFVILSELIQAEMKRREFRKKVPMSVFIDLEKK
jgi:hypothetical protein